jgi:hypothetical protein
VCLSDRAGYYFNELFRFSTTERKWEQLNATSSTRVSGSPPSARSDHGMVSVGSDFYVFGGRKRNDYGDTRKTEPVLKLNLTCTCLKGSLPKVIQDVAMLAIVWVQSR